MVNEKHLTLLKMWPLMKDDMQMFFSDRPGWLIESLSQARNKRGAAGWNDVETIINILQFLKDNEVEYY